jgi:hypothetical protein
MVAPPIHHVSAILEILSRIVGPTYIVAVAVGQLSLNPIAIKSTFVENG